jgi:hypothetical protein
MSYIGIPPFGQTARTVTSFIATESQTVFTPTGGYIVNYIDVYYNGVKLVNGDDYVATNGTSVTLTVAANAGDTIETMVYMPVSLTDTYRTGEVDAALDQKVNKSGDTMTGALTVSVSGSTFESRNADGYSRFTASNGSAQLGLFRAGEAAGGFYVGGDANNFRVYNSSFSPQLLVDASGRVTTPNQPAFVAHCNSSDQGSSANKVSNATIIFTGIKTNIGNHYNTSNGRFTAPVAGLYQFTFHSNLQTGSMSGWFNVSLNVSSGDFTYHYEDKLTTWQFISFTNMFYLNANDYVFLNLACQSGSVGCDGSAPWSRFEGRLVQ